MSFALCSKVTYLIGLSGRDRNSGGYPRRFGPASGSIERAPSDPPQFVQWTIIQSGLLNSMNYINVALRRNQRKTISSSLGRMYKEDTLPIYSQSRIGTVVRHGEEKRQAVSLVARQWRRIKSADAPFSCSFQEDVTTYMEKKAQILFFSCFVGGLPSANWSVWSRTLYRDDVELDKAHCGFAFTTDPEFRAL